MLLLDLKLPGGGGLKLLGEVKTHYPKTGVVVMTAFATVSSAVEAMRIGAGDYLTKPFALEQLTAVLGQSSRRLHFDLESRKLRERLRTERGMGNLIGTSPAMEKVYRILSKVAFSTHPVLILGESGTGKELVARSIHSSGPHASRPFIPVDCGSLVPTLIESELFGHVKGAFTGANRAKEGLLAAAEGGTVFLDEIGELPLDLQAKLLRALQEKEVRPVGATHAVPISARVLAATNRDLSAMVAQGLFRKDLYFRLNVVNLKIPPLRERREDIRGPGGVLSGAGAARVGHDAQLLRGRAPADDGIRLAGQRARAAARRSNAPARCRPGRCCIWSTCPRNCRTSARIDARWPTPSARRQAASNGSGRGSSRSPIWRSRRSSETIRQLKGDKLMAARLLGIGKTTLYRKLKEYGLAEAGESVAIETRTCVLASRASCQACVPDLRAPAAMLGLPVSHRELISGSESIHV